MEDAEEGLLSPLRIEAIDIAFHRTFASALKDEIIRDASTYPTLDEVLDISKRFADGLPVTDDELHMRRRRQQSVEILEVDEGEGAEEEGEGETREAVDNDEPLAFSDEETQPVTLQPHNSGEGMGSTKRTIEDVAGISPGDYVHAIETQITDLDPKKRQPDRPAGRRRPRRQDPSSETIIISDTESPPPQLPKPPQALSPPPKRAQFYYRDIPPLKSVTLVCQRRTRPKPRGLHIPFWGRKRTRAKKISLDGLWDVHYRLERARRSGTRQQRRPQAQENHGGGGRARDRRRGSRASGRGETHDELSGADVSVRGEPRKPAIDVVVAKRKRRGQPRKAKGGAVGATGGNSPEL